MSRWYQGGHVPVQHVGKALPWVGVIVGAGMNSHLLAAVALDAQRYCQTRFLADKYSLDLPEPLREEFDLI